MGRRHTGHRALKTQLYLPPFPPQSELSSSGFDGAQRPATACSNNPLGGLGLPRQEDRWLMEDGLMVRKNGQQGQRSKKAIQAICPTLPPHANPRHTHCSQGSLLSHVLPAHSHPGPCPTYSVHCPISLFLGPPQVARGKTTSLRCYRNLLTPTWV